MHVSRKNELFSRAYKYGKIKINEFEVRGVHENTKKGRD